MPKIYPSILISAMRGRSEGTIFQMWKTQIIARRYVKPHQPDTPARARYKGHVSTMAGCYDALSDPNKTGWACYAALLPTNMSGFNAFLGRNVTLLTADHPELVPYHTAPDVYSSPNSPAPIAASFCTFDGHYRVTWVTPAEACYYVQGFYAPQAGYSNVKFPPWKFSQTVAAALLSFDLDGSGFPAGTVIHFRARTLNVLGEPSPWTATESATKS